MRGSGLSYALVFCFLGLQFVTYGQDTSFTILSAYSTGRTTGHIATIDVKNRTAQTLYITPQIFYIPNQADYQSYVCCITNEVSLAPNDTVTIEVVGFCADFSKPALPAGYAMSPVETWVVSGEDEWLGQEIYKDVPIPEFSRRIRIIGEVDVATFSLDSIPSIITKDFIPVESVSAPLVWPGTDIQIEGYFSREADPKTITPVLVEALNRIAITFDALRNANNNLTPYSTYPERERAAVIQQSFWVFAAVLFGSSYSLDDFFDRVYEQYKLKTSKSPKSLSKAKKDELDSGIRNFWKVFQQTGRSARVLSSIDSPKIMDAVAFSTLWEDLQLDGVRMKPGYPYRTIRRVPTLPAIAGVGALGAGAYFVLKPKDLSEICAFSVGTETTDATCGLPNGSISIHVDPPGDYNYFWSGGGGGTSRPNALAGVYRITVTPADADCPQVGSDTVVNFDLPFTAELDITDASCGEDNGSASVSVEPAGDYEFTWSHIASGPSQSNLAPGKYTVTVSLGGDCHEELDFFIHEESIPFNVLSSFSVATCGVADGSAIAIVDPPADYDYVWSTGATTASIGNLPAGLYRVTVSQAGTKCDTALSVIVPETESNFILNVATSDANCGGVGGDIILDLQTHGPGPLVLSVSGPDGNNTIYVSEGIVHLNDYFTILPGTWTLSVRDLNLIPSCHSDTSVIIADITKPVVALDDYYETTINEIVHGNVLANDTGFQLYAILINPPSSGTVTINQSGSFIYIPPPDTAGLFTFIYRAVDGCGNRETRTVTILVKDCLIDASFTVTMADCGINNGSILTQVNPPANYTFLWSHGSTTPDLLNLPPDNYIVTITNSDNVCQRSYSVLVEDTSMLEIAVYEYYIPTEPGSTEGWITMDITFPAMPPYEILLNGSIWGSTSENRFTIDSLTTGAYHIQIRDLNGCLSNEVKVQPLMQGALRVDVGFGMAAMSFNPTLIPEQSQSEYEQGLRSFIDVGIHYGIAGISHRGGIMVYKLTPARRQRQSPTATGPSLGKRGERGEMGYRISELVEMWRGSFKDIELRALGGLSVDMVRGDVMNRSWEVGGVARWGRGKFGRMEFVMKMRGWERIEGVEMGVAVRMGVGVRMGVR